MVVLTLESLTPKVIVVLSFSRPDVTVKCLRYLARFLVVGLLLHKLDVSRSVVEVSLSYCYRRSPY